MKSYIYVLPTTENVLKIGRTNNPSERIASLNLFYTFNKEKSLILECLDLREAISLESLLHNTFNNQRVLLDTPGGTEFFDQSIYEDVKSMIEIISKNKNVQLFNISKVFNENEEIDDINKYMFNIFNTIKNKRLLLNISQQKLSKVSGLSKRTIERIENCEGTASFLNVIKLLKALNIDISIDQISDSSVIAQRAS